MSNFTDLAKLGSDYYPLSVGSPFVEFAQEVLFKQLITFRFFMVILERKFTFIQEKNNLLNAAVTMMANYELDFFITHMPTYFMEFPTVLKVLSLVVLNLTGSPNLVYRLTFGLFI